ncbi:cytochrome o ubiquinol oxidase subunit III [Buchnera aphidicola (Thelaxes californica)]|uniref:Cytochrome bo(3) ubiquinol oxidase subunit 3 n=1 Tax=Buchnera aphidicola (Thelaxes californica) TaxID=1315998 RepID=A0A4D6YJV8_9GAMM|nr:cytochrome c oxidase subunit 3 [Buchnera aphidicola]QCI26881.1 cytochrome o ubiquinol oxidase subunit III [Buchnera aphidicola (Thelaxes californica)]
MKNKVFSILDQKHLININNTVNDKKLLGFWLYLMSDCIIFASIFAVYFVMRSHSFINFNIYQQKFNYNFILTETILLLCSSFTCGIATSSVYFKKIYMTYIWLLITFIFGISFVCMELFEIHNFFQKDFSPQKDGLFSSIFTLLSMHVIHVFVGLIWIFFIIIQMYYFNINKNVYTNLLCLSLFWHFLDIIWIFLYTFIYFIR